MPEQNDTVTSSNETQVPLEKNQQQEATEQNSRSDRRQKVTKIALSLTVGFVLFVGVLLWWLHARNYEETDDAQVDGHLHPIAARVDGTVIAVHAEDNQTVKAGDLLIELDPRDYAVALDQSKASYQQAFAQLQAQNPNLPITQVSNQTVLSTGQAEIATAKASLAAAEQDQAGSLAQLAQAEANNDKAQADLNRYARLRERDEVSQQDYDQYLATSKEQAATVDQRRAALRSAGKTIEQRKAQLAEQEARLDQQIKSAPRQIAIQQGNIASMKAYADVAQTKIDQAVLNLGYTKLYAPVSGIITQRSGEAGAKVSVGQQMLMLVQTDDLWITANFRETQLRNVAVGHQVKIHVDSLDKDFSGYVQSLPAASGDRTSVLPTENATGNYVKVVQRLPVRIRFKPNQPELDLLRPGMSVEPTIALR